MTRLAWLLPHPNIRIRIAVTTQPPLQHRAARPQVSLIIVVDDDAAVRNSSKFSLDMEGFTIRLFSNSNEQLHSSDLSDCCCLIIDQRLPETALLDHVLVAIGGTGLPQPARS